MTDDQWLRAMAKYNADREDWKTFTGGAREQAQVLKDETAADPARFAQLALRLTDEAHPSYADAILQGIGDSEVPVEPALVFEAMRHIATFRHGDKDRWLGWALRRHLKDAIPDDIIVLLLDRAIHAPDPAEELWEQEPSGNGAYYEGDPQTNGMNTARGAAAEILGDILVNDADGHRTALVVPYLNQLAEDSSVAVRACVAHLVAASLRHARPKAAEAFGRLIQTDDRLFGTRSFQNLVVYIGNGEPAIVEPIIERMMATTDARVQRAGGSLAAYAGLELGLGGLLTTARTHNTADVRKGAAGVCAQRLAHTTNTAAATVALLEFMKDSDDEVRKDAAKVAVALGGQSLQPFKELLVGLIRSPSCVHAESQLLITLERATDRVDELIVDCAKRFIDIHGADVGDMATGAAGNAREVGELLLRAYVQADVTDRSAVLDLLDDLLAFGAYGVAELVGDVER